MEEQSWTEEIQSVCETAAFLKHCDVIDISLSDGSDLEVYVAISQPQRQRGLSEVASLDLDGMLFFYSQPSYTPFTMEKMKIDLDIAWYDKSGKLLDHATYPAGHKNPIYVTQPFSYVLEAPAGTLPKADLEVKL